MTVVLDTNVIVAALVAKGLCHEVVVRALGSGTVVTSPVLLDELERALGYHKLRRDVSPEAAIAAVGGLERGATRANDPDDDAPLRSAVPGHDYRIASCGGWPGSCKWVRSRRS